MLKYLRARIQSFGYAFKGIAIFWRTQAHAKIHVVAAILVVSLGTYLQVQPWEWCALVSAITLVLVAEAFNTSIEFLTDLISPNYHPLAGKAKDVAAGAVLLAAIGAMIIGILIFLPHLVVR